jgi:hypothetical protein
MEKSDISSSSNQSEIRQKNTFIVKIDHCQRGTWQGQIVWAEENRTERFRSALELMKLMDEAMAGEAQVQLDQAKTS